MDSSQFGTLEALAGLGRQHHTLSKLSAAWRLKGVACNGSTEETEIRIPPLQPGECFSDRYKAGASSLAYLVHGGRHSKPYRLEYGSGLLLLTCMSCIMINKEGYLGANTRETSNGLLSCSLRAYCTGHTSHVVRNLHWYEVYEIFTGLPCARPTRAIWQSRQKHSRRGKNRQAQ